MLINYETATDRELELALCKLLNVHNDDESFFENENLINCRPNYCTDWNATMPMAVEHGVCLKSPIKANKMWLAIWNEWGGIWTPNELQVKSESPLRAIVICLIKVLEAKNDAGQK
ncbi:hypothetical protein [Vibrio fluvialis]|uniref:hypothetical protein n=1 Tax=Vibrio fluvialis TaxID=676 RepID=UPI001C9C6072|nr:hypothetical protein [Vibrio fluvialis]MBY7952253.1 hypothetical protein [Vibrio fluvialis]MBY7979277.1 hypothetical protein [Vibrio fluvialis]